MIEFKVSKKSQYDALKEFINTTIFYLCFTIFLLILLIVYSEFGILEITIVLLMGLIPYAIFFLYPIAIIHSNYLKNAIYQVIELSENQIKIDSILYTSDNIKKIDVYASYSYLAGGSGTNYSVHEVTYYKIEIHLENQKRIYLSSLYGQSLYPNIKECFSNTLICEHKLLFVPKYLI